MNLYFRLIWILLRSRFAARIGLLDESRLKFRAWPLDCDINFHLTNSRYFAMCDLCRTYFLGQVGILFKVIRRKCLPVAQAQEITYFRPIHPFQRIEIRSRLSYWDDKYWYAEHRFFAANKLCAVLQVRGVFVQGRKVIPFNDVLAMVDEEAETPDKPVAVKYWQSLIESRKIGAEDSERRSR